MWTVEGFIVFDDARVDVELLSARVTVTTPTEIALYVHAFSASSPQWPSTDPRPAR